MRAMLRALGVFGMIKCVIFAPYCEIAYKVYEKKQKKIAESKGMTLEEYWESMIIYH